MAPGIMAPEARRERKRDVVKRKVANAAAWFQRGRAGRAEQAKQGAAAILGIGVSVEGLPCGTTDEFVDKCRTALAGTQSDEYIDFLCKRTANSGIIRRYHAAFDDWSDENLARSKSKRVGLYNQAEANNPTAGPRQQLWAEHAPRLAIDAAEKAVQNWGGDRQSITHIVFHSCTGFKAPGVELDVMDALGLKNIRFRTGINFMGCFGGLNGLKVAKALVESEPGAVCLLVCVEICSAHFSMDPNRGKFIGNSIFADGGSAAVVGPGGPGDWVLTGGGTHILGKDTRAAMTWFPSDNAYEMYLDKSIGNSLGWYIFKNLGPMLSEACQTTNKNSVHWAIHPGGKAILEGLEKVGVSQDDLKHSWHILEQYGNMSSATILFVLQASLADPTMQKDRLFSLAFGPGLTIETVGLVKLSTDMGSDSESSSSESS